VFGGRDTVHTFNFGEEVFLVLTMKGYLLLM